MYRNLPPLNSLRFFEAAARHLSFTKAAEELYVSQAAISHQVKALETHLRVKLFRRQPRRLLLTDEGQMLLPVVQEAFARLGDTARKLTEDAVGGTLRVAVRPYFAARWLAPRLSRFWQRHPGIDFRLIHSTEEVDFSRVAADLGVRWGRGSWPGVESELLLKTEVTPVCSPALLKGKGALKNPADLRHHRLLHEDNYKTWRQWLKAAGAKTVNPRRGPIIEDTNVRTQAAIDGQGVAFGALPLIADDLATGRLVAPFELTLSDLAYYIIYPPGALSRPKVRAFRDWLIEEAAESDVGGSSASA